MERKRRKPAKASPVSTALLDSGRHYAREDLAARLGLLFAATRDRANLYQDPLLLLACDVMDGVRAALYAEDKPAMGKGATWGRRQRGGAVERLAKPVNLVRDLRELPPAVELAFRILRSGLVSPLSVATAAVQDVLDEARGRGREGDVTVKRMLIAMGIPENTATNWAHSALNRDGPAPPKGKR